MVWSEATPIFWRRISDGMGFFVNRDKIFELLSLKGYGRVFEKFSIWDDWYVSVERLTT
jgi:hypothetical protein